MIENPVLSFDTCAAAGTVALVDLQHATATVSCLGQKELGGRAASAQLVPAIDTLLTEAGLRLGDLRAILVVNGPGSFTGVRVGLSTTKALAHATGVPIAAISRLAVLANLGEAGPGSVVLLDAGRNEFYARCDEREWLASFEEIATVAAAGAPLLVAERAVAERLSAWNPRLVAPLDAVAAARAALPRLRSGEWDDIATLDANYLRRSDAELFSRPLSTPVP